MKNKIITLVGIITIFAFIGLMFYAGFYIKRTINYSWFYEDAVKTTIKEMVKKESLK